MSVICMCKKNGNTVMSDPHTTDKNSWRKGGLKLMVDHMYGNVFIPRNAPFPIG